MTENCRGEMRHNGKLPGEMRHNGKLPGEMRHNGSRSALGRVGILRFTTVQCTFSSLRCPYNRHAGLRRNPAS